MKIIFILVIGFWIDILGMSLEKDDCRSALPNDTLVVPMKQDEYLGVLPRDIISLLNPLVLTVKIKETETFGKFLQKLQDLSKIKVFLCITQKLYEQLLELKIISYTQALDKIQMLSTETEFDPVFNNLDFTELLLPLLYRKARYENQLIVLDEIANTLKTQRIQEWLRIRPQQLKLIDAVEKRDIQRIKNLLDQGINVNTKDTLCQPVLVTAAYKDFADVMVILIAYGAHLNAQDYAYKNTALIWAACIGHNEAVKILIKAGADLNAQSENGETALMIAARNGRTEAAELLIKAGANLHSKDKDGYTAIRTAIGFINNDIVGLLLIHGAPLNDSKLPLPELVGNVFYAILSAGVLLTKRTSSWLSKSLRA